MVEEPTESSSISDVLSSLSTDDCGLMAGGFLSAAAFLWCAGQETVGEHFSLPLKGVQTAR